MRIVSGVLAVLLVVFMVVQFNDPDGPIWMVIYGIGAVWCLIAAIGGMVYFWPEVSNWWDIDVWWPEITGETSREGMGMMVLVVFLSVAGLTMMRHRGS